MGRYGWKLAGFRACQGAGIESIVVHDDHVSIDGFYPGSFPSGFCGYYAKQQQRKLYVGFRFSPVFGFFETGRFSVSIPLTAPVEEIILKTSQHEFPLWTASPNLDELVGPWHLSEETDEIFNAFPGAMEFGSVMEIRSDGRIAWYVGAEGVVGTYTLDGNTLHCSLTNTLDNRPMLMDFTFQKQDGESLLTTVYQDIKLRWKWGEGETLKGE